MMYGDTAKSIFLTPANCSRGYKTCEHPDAVISMLLKFSNVGPTS